MKVKYCPLCKKDYADPALSFCLEDGTALTQPLDGRDGEPTLEIPNRAYATTEPATKTEIETLKAQLADANLNFARLNYLAGPATWGLTDVGRFVPVLDVYILSDECRNLDPQGTPFVEFGLECFNASVLPVTIERETDGFVLCGKMKLDRAPKVYTFKNSHSYGERFRFRLRQELTKQEADFINGEHSKNVDHNTFFDFARLEVFVCGGPMSTEVKRGQLDWNSLPASKISIAEVIATTPVYRPNSVLARDLRQ